MLSYAHSLTHKRKLLSSISLSHPIISFPNVISNWTWGNYLVIRVVYVNLTSLDNREDLLDRVMLPMYFFMHSWVPSWMFSLVGPAILQQASPRKRKGSVQLFSPRADPAIVTKTTKENGNIDCIVLSDDQLLGSQLLLLVYKRRTKVDHKISK